MKFLRDRNVRDKWSVKNTASPAKSARVSTYAPAARKHAPAANLSAHNNVHVRARADAQPVIRLRTVLIGLCVLAVCMLGPLALVWKQSYINQVSIRLENSAQTLKVLNGEITSLELERTRLLAAPRIERIALSRGFEYPTSERMVILGVGGADLRNGDVVGKLTARVRSFILGERG